MFLFNQKPISSFYMKMTNMSLVTLFTGFYQHKINIYKHIVVKHIIHHSFYMKMTNMSLVTLFTGFYQHKINIYKHIVVKHIIHHNFYMKTPESLCSLGFINIPVIVCSTFSYFFSPSNDSLFNIKIFKGWPIFRNSH